jgi:hypothetical protein
VTGNYTVGDYLASVRLAEFLGQHGKPFQVVPPASPSRGWKPRPNKGCTWSTSRKFGETKDALSCAGSPTPVSVSPSPQNAVIPESERLPSRMVS